MIVDEINWVQAVLCSSCHFRGKQSLPLNAAIKFFLAHWAVVAMDPYRTLAGKILVVVSSKLVY